MPDLPDISAPPVFTPVVQPAITEGAPLKVVSEFDPSGDQPDAIEGLVTGLLEEEKDQVLLGVMGSGKTFTIASVIQETQRPAMILAPNKTKLLTELGFKAMIAGTLVSLLSATFVGMLLG